MPRQGLEVADIFRAHGAAWRHAQAGHLSLGQLKVMSAIERCRTAALGGHVAACDTCDHIHIAYNSCRNRHCPKCQGAAARDWLAAREAELLPLEHCPIILNHLTGLSRLLARRVRRRGLADHKVGPTTSSGRDKPAFGGPNQPARLGKRRSAIWLIGQAV